MWRLPLHDGCRYVCLKNTTITGLTSLAGRDAYANDHDSNACGPRVIVAEEGDIVREIFLSMEIFPWLLLLHQSSILAY